MTFNLIILTQQETQQGCVTIEHWSIYCWIQCSIQIVHSIQSTEWCLPFQAWLVLTTTSYGSWFWISVTDSYNNRSISHINSVFGWTVITRSRDTEEAFVPPKPNELVRATLRPLELQGCAVQGHIVQVKLWLGAVQVEGGGGRVLWWQARAVKAASSAPAAPSRWPLAPLVEDTDSEYACLAQNSLLMAAFSAASPSGVEVAWALTYVTSEGDTPASRRAADMHLKQQTRHN